MLGTAGNSWALLARAHHMTAGRDYYYYKVSRLLFKILAVENPLPVTQCHVMLRCRNC